MKNKIKGMFLVNFTQTQSDLDCHLNLQLTSNKISLSLQQKDILSETILSLNSRAVEIVNKDISTLRVEGELEYSNSNLEYSNGSLKTSIATITPISTKCTVDKSDFFKDFYPMSLVNYYQLLEKYKKAFKTIGFNKVKYKEIKEIKFLLAL